MVRKVALPATFVLVFSAVLASGCSDDATSPTPGDADADAPRDAVAPDDVRTDAGDGAGGDADPDNGDIGSDMQVDFDGGGLPYNTHGGMLSHAYVLGIAHVVEVVRQLRGQAANQVAGAEVGVYGGYTGHMASTLVLRSEA